MRQLIRILLVLLSLVTGGAFLYSAWTKLFPIQPFEYTIVEYLHLPWALAAVAARAIIGLEAALGGLIVLHLWGRKQQVLKAAAGLLVVFSLYLVWLWAKAGNDVNCGCFGDAIWMSPSASLIKNAALMGSLLMLMAAHRGMAFKNDTLFTSLLFITGITLPFILYPMMLGEPDWLKKGVYKLNAAPLYHPIKDTTVSEPYPDRPTVDIMHGKHIVAFLSPSCEHCRIAARKISLMRRNDTTLPFLMVIGGVSSDLTDFWKHTKAQNVPWMRLQKDPFMDYTGGRFPTIIWVNEGMVVAQSSYNTLTEGEVEKWLKGK